ncbi:WD40-repeat-containing domain protein [Protomyces lactucae-debilis]|uniref:WD40-repeat-containing domain protein n=1 Tax=Protomyces lactucae-debilis TaxID=2754530 RepID=A0A1Y2EQU2_PROLT|nr:WD40-repeat-containing domain protein [Protomyces lactucae-debilis]ORY73928.1 WD40-repeat-containing domain protein [Protomyces lactucae-debilis]
MASSAGDMSLPTVIQFLQTENARFERDRNYWELEKAEMKSHIARLEGERKGNERIKDWYLRRLRMLELSLQQERFKNDPTAQFNESSVLDDAKQEIGVQISRTTPRSKLEHTESYLETVRESQDSLRDASGRDRSRKYLEKCLSEITYLTASLDMPQEAAAATSQKPGASNSSNRSDMDVMADQLPIRVPSPAADDPHKAQRAREHDSADHNFATRSSEPLLADEDELEPDVRVSHIFDANGNLQAESQVVMQNWDTKDEARHTNHDEPLRLHGRLRGHLDRINAIISIRLADSWLVTASTDATIRIYRLSQEEPGVILRAHTNAVLCLVEDTDRTTPTQLCFFSAGEDGTVRHWSIPLDILAQHPEFQPDLLPDLILQGHTAAICHLAFDGDRLYSSSNDGTICVWSPWSEAPRLFNLQSDSIQNVLPISLSTLGDPIEDQVAVQYNNGTVVLFRRSDGMVVRQLCDEQASQLPISLKMIYLGTGHLLVSPDGLNLSSFDLVSDAGKFATSTSIARSEDHLSCFANSLTDNSLVTAYTNGSLRIWDCTSWQCMQELTCDEDAGEPCCATWAHDDSGSESLVIGSQKGTISVFSG